MPILFILIIFFISSTFAALPTEAVTVFGKYVGLKGNVATLMLVDGRKIELPKSYFPKSARVGESFLNIDLPIEILEREKNFNCHYQTGPSPISTDNQNCKSVLCQAKVQCGAPILFGASVICPAVEGKCPDALSCLDANIEASLEPVRVEAELKTGTTGKGANATSK